MQTGFFARERCERRVKRRAARRAHERARRGQADRLRQERSGELARAGARAEQLRSRRGVRELQGRDRPLRQAEWLVGRHVPDRVLADERRRVDDLVDRVLRLHPGHVFVVGLI